MADEPRDNDINEETPPEPQDEPTSQEPQPKRLVRSSGDNIIGGVAGGLGRYFNVDPILFRIAFVVLTFTGGIGVLAYLALLVFVPSDDSEAPANRSQVAALAGAAVLGLAFVTFLDGPFFFGPGVFIVGLAGVAAVLLWRAFRRDDRSDPARTFIQVVLVGVVAFLVVCLAIGVGIAAALGGGVVIAALAIVAGLALIATAFFGGARWLIVPALTLVLPLAIVAAADIDLDGGIGDRDYRPASLTDLRDRYEIGVGELDVDLRDVDLPAGRTDLAVDVGVGHALVWVPSGACITSDMAIGAGVADMLDREVGGVDVDLDEAAMPSAGRPQLHIDADVGLGAIEVVREGFRPDWDDRDRFDRWESEDNEESTSERGLSCT